MHRWFLVKLCNMMETNGRVPLLWGRVRYISVAKKVRNDNNFIKALCSGASWACVASSGGEGKPVAPPAQTRRRKYG